MLRLVRDHFPKELRNTRVAHLAGIGQFTALGSVAHLTGCIEHRHRRDALLQRHALADGNVNILSEALDVNFHHFVILGDDRRAGAFLECHV